MHVLSCLGNTTARVCLALKDDLYAILPSKNSKTVPHLQFLRRAAWAVMGWRVLDLQVWCSSTRCALTLSSAPSPSHRGCSLCGLLPGYSSSLLMPRHGPCFLPAGSLLCPALHIRMHFPFHSDKLLGGRALSFNRPAALARRVKLRKWGCNKA